MLVRVVITNTDSLLLNKMNYSLKDKIQVTDDFLSKLESKGWQEIEHLQLQITNLEVSADNNQIIKLLQSLLTSYYVFVGGLENLTSGYAVEQASIATEAEIPATEIEADDLYPGEKLHITTSSAEQESATEAEPFEYFVDFDEPFGEPISDEDLYGIK